MINTFLYNLYTERVLEWHAEMQGQRMRDYALGVGSAICGKKMYAAKDFGGMRKISWLLS
jgi:hypothetical protein